MAESHQRGARPSDRDRPGAAANTLFIAAFIERGFEAFQASTEVLGRDLDPQVKSHTRNGNGDWGANRERS